MKFAVCLFFIDFFEVREYELIIQNFSHSDGKRFLVEFISETGLNEGLMKLESRTTIE